MKIVENRTVTRFAPILVASLFALNTGAAFADSESGFVFGNINYGNSASLEGENETTLGDVAATSTFDSGAESDSGGALDSGGESETGGTKEVGSESEAGAEAGENFVRSKYVQYYGDRNYYGK
ncbi:MAG: hypothetical protein K2Z81_15135 [Cyanobacteria bacterium]|nr:hypothetical protein [Cyanobacteriota bacterium]